MPNRILVDVQDGLEPPPWLCNVEPFMQRALSAAGYDGQEVSVLFCGDAFMQGLNAQYRNVDAPTDVLSFEGGGTYTDEDGLPWFAAGDIVVSVETLPRNAAYFSVGQDEELKRLLVHGMLHLNGWDHGDEHVQAGVEPECEMLRLQKELMGTLALEHIIVE